MTEEKTKLLEIEDYKKYKEFRKALDHLLEFWKQKEDFDASLIIPALIQEAKLEACYHFDNYLEILGILISLTTEQSEEMFDDIQEAKAEADEIINKGKTECHT